jgi:hypothetical protein
MEFKKENSMQQERKIAGNKLNMIAVKDFSSCRFHPNLFKYCSPDTEYV